MSTILYLATNNFFLNLYKINNINFNGKCKNIFIKINILLKYLFLYFKKKKKSINQKLIFKDFHSFSFLLVNFCFSKTWCLTTETTADL